MVMKFVSIVEQHRGFEPRLVQTNTYRIDICCFSGKQAALRSLTKTCWFGIKWEWNLYPWTFVTLSYHYKDAVKHVVSSTK